MSYVKYRYPKEVLDIARKRVKELMSLYCLQTTTLSILLQSAYLQGIIDLAEAEEKPKKASNDKA